MIPLWKDTDGNPDEIRSAGLSEAELRHRELSKMAYLIWVNKGGGNGHDLEDWLEAEQEYDAT